MTRVAIIGGGMAGLAAAYELTRQNAPFVLYEASTRLGGIIETTREEGFVMECGPDGWVSEKPWARELCLELGLEDELIPSNDAERITYVLREGTLHAIPSGMRMMVPTDLGALRESKLFSSSAIAAYEQEPQHAEELKAYAEGHSAEDESVASFVRRHFGEEVTRTIAAPLLAGVFGGDVERLSAQSVMPQFLAMERSHGSIILALRERSRTHAKAIFTTLRSGLGTLIDAMTRALPEDSVRLQSCVQSIEREADFWKVCAGDASEIFDAVFLATPVHRARSLMASVDAEAAQLLAIGASSAVIIGFGFSAEQAKSLSVPRGFGFLVPPGGEESDLLAATFSDQKFFGRAPEGGRALRAFFGGNAGERLQGESDGWLIALAKKQLGDALGCELPEAALTIVRRWPLSLPQYEVGHADRMRRLNERLNVLPGLTLLGNAYRGVGLPDLIRDGRAAARQVS
jgi:protoporphyrinogen/coproporphyrinogen III oxidase